MTDTLTRAPSIKLLPPGRSPRLLISINPSGRCPVDPGEFGESVVLSMFRTAFALGLLSFIFLLIAPPVHSDMFCNFMPLIAQAESSGDPGAISEDGGYGLYQITQPVLIDYNKRYGTTYRLEDMLNPVLCYDVAYDYLRWIQKYIRRYRPDLAEDVPTIVLCYNAGPSRVRLKYKWQIPDWARNHRNLIYRELMNGGFY